jgi:hypothetical protein
MNKIIHKVITINAPTIKVWNTLTNPDIIKEWISEEETSIISDWEVGSPLIFKAKWHGVMYENKGVILQFEPEKVFKYNYWSVFSRLPDSPENYSIIEQKLIPKENQTEIELKVSNLLNEAIYGHWNFYWAMTLDIIKKLIEKQL